MVGGGVLRLQSPSRGKLPVGRRQIELLLPLVGAVVAATVVQGLGSFALVQLVSKAAQKLIADIYATPPAVTERLRGILAK